MPKLSSEDTISLLEAGLNREQILKVQEIVKGWRRVTINQK